MNTSAGAPAGRPGDHDAGQALEIRIDRLALRAAGLDEDAARLLGRLVAEGLTPGLLRPAGLAGVDSLYVEVQAAAAEQGKPDLLARRLIDEIGRALARDRVFSRPGGEVAG